MYTQITYYRNMASSYNSYIKHVTVQQNHHQQASASATSLADLSSAPNRSRIRTLSCRLQINTEHAHLRKAGTDDLPPFLCPLMTKLFLIKPSV